MDFKTKSVVKKFFCFSLITIIVLIPKVSLACGVCTMLVEDYYLPFLRSWILVFFSWLIIYFVLDAERGNKFTMYRGLKIVVIFVLLTCGGPLVPFLFYFIWWSVKVISIILNKPANPGLDPKWWQIVNTAFLIGTLILITFSYIFQSSNPKSMSKFLTYRGGPHRQAIARTVKYGERAIPVIIDEMVNYESERYNKERIQREGVEMIEKITGKDFDHNRERCLEWWKKNKKRY